MATAITNPGGLLNSVPTVEPVTMASNFVDLASSGWAQQYLPELMEKEAEVFGNRTVSGFLAQVGAEEPMASDQVVWSEQGRLHLAYQGNASITSADPSRMDFTVVKDIDGNGMGGNTGGVRVGDLVVVTDANAELKGYVSAVGTSTISSVDYPKITIQTLQDSTSNFQSVTAADDNVTYRLFVYGSEYGKATTGRTSANQTQFKSFTNKPVIMKDRYEVSGSDAAQIGWVEVSGEDGQNGYLWYLKAAGDTKARFTDYCEMTLLEHELVDAASGTAGNQAITGHAAAGGGTAAGNIEGTEGLFAAVESRGQVFDGLLPVATATQALADFDAVLAAFDEQGAIEEYMLFCNRDLSLTVDDMLAGMSAYGAGGTSYGVFDNDEDMALNLGFSGFRRGSYDFYKSDWKYLNDKATRGGAFGGATGVGIRGAFVPAGVTSVYDQNLGKNLKRPFLHVRYRKSQMEDRKFKTWTTGSVGAKTSDLDAMEMHFLTERCLVTQGANNFMLVKGIGSY